MGNQENIPGECVSGFMPATETTNVVNTDFLKKRARRCHGDDLLRVTSLYSVVSKYPAKP